MTNVWRLISGLVFLVMWNAQCRGQQMQLHSALNIGFGGHVPYGIMSSFTNAGIACTMDSTVDVYFYGNRWKSTASDGFAQMGGRIHFASTTVQQVLDGDTSGFQILAIENPFNVVLSASVRIEEELKLEEGKVVLNGSTLILDSNTQVTSYDENNYIVNDSVLIKGGEIIVHSNADSQLRVVPIGPTTTLYAPVRFRSNTADTLHFQVFETVLDSGRTGTPISQPNSNITWGVTNTSGQAHLSVLEVQFPSNNTTANFDENHVFVSRYHGAVGNQLGDSSSSNRWEAMKKSSVNQVSSPGVITTADTLWSSVVVRADSFTTTTVFSVLSYPASSLPVHWLEVRAHWLQANAAVVDWSTAMELNNAYYEVQRSAGGRYFKSIGKVTSKHTGGTGYEQANYRFLDNAIPASYNNVFYRVIQHDFDGKQDTSSAMRLQRRAMQAGGLRIIPNPNNGHFYVSVEQNAPGNRRYIVYNTLGAVVDSGNLKENKNRVEINNRHLNTGMYHLVLENLETGGRSAVKIIIHAND